MITLLIFFKNNCFSGLLLEKEISNKKFEFNKLKARFGASIKSVHEGQPLAGDINKLFSVKKINGKTSAASKYIKVLRTDDLKSNKEVKITANPKQSKNFKTSSAPRLATAADLGMI